MTTYIYSKWPNNSPEYPVEFFSELDEFRNETRKIEVFSDGRIGYASNTKNKYGTILGIIPVPSMNEIKSQLEFESREITKEEFEQKWLKATSENLK